MSLVENERVVLVFFFSIDRKEPSNRKIGRNKAAVMTIRSIEQRGILFHLAEGMSRSSEKAQNQHGMLAGTFFFFFFLSLRLNRRAI